MERQDYQFFGAIVLLIFMCCGYQLYVYYECKTGKRFCLPIEHPSKNDYETDETGSGQVEFVMPGQYNHFGATGNKPLMEFNGVKVYPK